MRNETRITAVSALLLITASIYCNPAAPNKTEYCTALSEGYNTNITLDKYMFQDIMLPAEGDYFTKLSLGFNYDNHISSFSYYYEFNALKYHKLDIYDYTRNMFVLKYHERIRPRVNFNCSLNMIYYDENNFTWDYFQYGATGLINFENPSEKGTNASIYYEWQRNKNLDRVPYEKLDSFNKVGYNLHTLDLRMNYRHNTRFRTTLACILYYEVWDRYVSEDLLSYSGYRIINGIKINDIFDRTRKDFTSCFHLEENAKINSCLDFSFFYEYKDNLSGSNRYIYSANQLGMEVIIMPADNHALKFTLKRSVYDYFRYYENLFDMVIVPTLRRDLRYEACAGYKLRIKKYYQLGLDYYFNENQTNNLVVFDPELDISGYPGYSKTLTNIYFRADF